VPGRVKDFRKWWVPEGSMIKKLERLFFAAGFDTLFERGEKVGLKVHMGEPGDVHYPRPIYVTQIYRRDVRAWLACRSGFCKKTSGCRQEKRIL